MRADNFNFDGDLDGESWREEAGYTGAFEKHLTVEHILCLKFGKERGRSIYRSLAEIAEKAAQENGGEPGLIFNESGGEFVSFHQRYE